MKNIKLKPLIAWLPATLYMCLIFYMSSHPAPAPIKAVPIYYDIKLVHVIEYGVLSGLIFFGIFNTYDIPLSWMSIYSITLTYIYGLTDELHQVFVPSRTGRLTDTIANFIGAIIFQAVIYSFVKKRKS